MASFRNPMDAALPKLRIDDISNHEMEELLS